MIEAIDLHCVGGEGFQPLPEVWAIDRSSGRALERALKELVLVTPEEILLPADPLVEPGIEVSL
jgi:hypothetical protein